MPSEEKNTNKIGNSQSAHFSFSIRDQARVSSLRHWKLNIWRAFLQYWFLFVCITFQQCKHNKQSAFVKNLWLPLRCPSINIHLRQRLSAHLRDTSEARWRTGAWPPKCHADAPRVKWMDNTVKWMENTAETTGFKRKRPIMLMFTLLESHTNKKL